MPVIAFIIIGLAAGFVATRLMKIDADLPTTVAIGVFGALIGGFVLRSLIVLTSWAAGFAGAVLGALLLIWAWKTYLSR
ncbi:MAG: GlsB/YeaQ/YmgE family stress response membrane protein [Pseudomonadota bacterium]